MLPYGKIVRFACLSMAKCFFVMGISLVKTLGLTKREKVIFKHAYQRILY